MPTKHRRIAIIRDDEVERALGVARDAGPRSASDAAVARELILRGAEELERENGEQDPFREWLREKGGTPASYTTREAFDKAGPLPPYDPSDPYPAQRILDDLREDRI